MKLTQFLDQEQNEEGQEFKVTDESRANWALRKIIELDKQIEKNINIAEAEIFKIESWIKQENEKSQESIDYFQSLLGEYALQQRETDPKFKSLKLPNGTVRFRKQQPEFKYDDAVLVDYLKKEGETDLIKVKETPNKTAIKKLFPIHDGKLINVGTGEAVEGVMVEYREDKFEVITDE